MQRGVEQNPPKKTGGFYSTPLLEGRGSAFINAQGPHIKKINVGYWHFINSAM
jgi:hypothetical protein